MRIALVAALVAGVLLAIPAPAIADDPVLKASVGPGSIISLKDANGNLVTHLTPGTYDIEVKDLGSQHNFHLTGTGFTPTQYQTGIGQTGTINWNDVVFTDGGLYHFQCDAHDTTMFGDFDVGPPPPDSTPPVITPIRTPAANANGWNSTDVDVTFDVADAESTVTATSAPCDTTTSITTETAGTDVTCEATSTGGTDSVTVTVKIDKTAPDADVDAGPPNPDTATTATLTFSADETSTFTCALDGGPFSACTSPKIYTKLKKRSHTFEVVPTDVAGNEGDAAPFEWTNGTPPTTKIGTKLKVTGPTVDVTFTSGDPGATFGCELDAGMDFDCFSPLHLSGLGHGPHQLAVWSVDAAGRTGPEALAAWNVDAQAPETTIVQHPADPTPLQTAKFTFTSSEKKSTFQCKLDAGGFGACPKKGYTGLADGSHTFEVRATDAFGNTDATPDTFTWMVELS